MTKGIIKQYEPTEYPQFGNSSVGHTSVDLLSNDVCSGLEDILSPKKEGKIAKITPNQRVPFVSEQQRNELSPFLDEIQAGLGITIPKSRIFDAINTIKMVNLGVPFLYSHQNLKLLIQLLELRPDYPFHLIKENHRVFPQEIMIIFMYGNHNDLDFFRKVDLHTFYILVKTGLSKLVRGISTEEIEKILRIVSLISESDIHNIRGYLQLRKGSLSQVLAALTVLLEKGIDLSYFTELNNKLSSEYGKNDQIFDEFRESGVLNDFQNLIMNHPELSKREIEESIRDILESAPGVQEKINNSDQEWIDQFGGFFQTENFNAEEGIAYILRLPSGLRKDTLKRWKELYKTQMTVLSQIPGLVQKVLFDEGKIHTGSTDEVLHGIVSSLNSVLIQLSIKQRKEVILRIRRYITKAKLVQQYAGQYKDNPQELVAKCLDTDVTKLKGDITMEAEGAHFTFFIHNGYDFDLLSSCGEEIEGESSDYGVSLEYSKIDELRGAITLIKGPKTEQNKSIQIHESAHADNYYVMPDLHNGDELSRAKNEIIAYLKEGVDITEIALRLLKRGGVYDYYGETNEEDSERYLLLRQLYEEELSKIIRIAEGFHRKRNIFPYYLDLLRITPAREWHRLEEFFL